MAMGTTLKWCLVVLLALMFVLGPGARTAEAYIDPGTGSMVIQVLLGTLLAGGFALKLFWRQITGFLARLFARRRPGPGESPDG